MLWRRFGVVLACFAACAATAGARDRGADGRFSERKSSHFVLYQDVALERYSGPNGARAFERGVLLALETAHDRVRDQLGLEPRARVRVVVYDSTVFDQAYAPRFGFRAAGFFDGTVHVRGGTRVDLPLVATLTHEYVHAALAAFAPVEVWPAWLNEGLAEYFERQSFGRAKLTFQEDALLRAAAANGEWLPLADLSGPTFAGLSEPLARLAYLESYAALELVFRRYGKERVERLIEELARTRLLERALQRALRLSLAELEAQLLAELR